MTTSLERPVRPAAPVYPSQAVCNELELIEQDLPCRAVVTMRAAVNRDMLALALDKGTSGDETDPEGWSVEFIRKAAEYEVAMTGTYGLWSDSYLIARAADDPDVGPRVRAIYRAVDRAYPEVQS